MNLLPKALSAMRVLFILKNQLISGGYSGAGRSSGLYTSAQLVCDMLRERLGHTCELAVVHDNNDINREVTRFQPDAVIIEALWVVPEKFEVLNHLHPRVTWLIRNHSALPFLAQEGSAMDWMLRYPEYRKVFTSCNDLRTHAEFQFLSQVRGLDKEVLYLPNYYPTEFHPRRISPGSRQLNIGCFGAIRPLKNQLIQAVAAIEYAESENRLVHFHINGTRLEGGGDPIRKNMRSLFNQTPHNLVEHGWLHRRDFIRLVRRMDAGMQCSYTETFNIVTADCVMNDVPVVASPEIEWVSPQFQADPNDSADIAHKLGRAIKKAHRQHESRDRLVQFSQEAVRAWASALGSC